MQSCLHINHISFPVEFSIDYHSRSRFLSREQMPSTIVENSPLYISSSGIGCLKPVKLNFIRAEELQSTRDRSNPCWNMLKSWSQRTTHKQSPYSNLMHTRLCSVAAAAEEQSSQGRSSHAFQAANDDAICMHVITMPYAHRLTKKARPSFPLFVLHIN